MRILIGADIVPTRSNASLFQTGNIRELLGDELIRVLESADYRIFNLEAPLTNTESPILKCGKSFIASPDCVAALQKMKVDLVTLANNHILDQGEQGLKETIKTLSEAGISYVGAGENLKEANKPFVFMSGGDRIGVYACAEHEFSIAGDNAFGANPFDPLESFDHISELKQKCKFVIVLYHGGKEYYKYPSPQLQKVCRKMIEKGADLVVCQHTHCIGAEEKYNSGTILYGQGNFIFDGSQNECWKTSLLIQIGENFEIEYIPIQKEGHRVRLAQSEKGNRILDEFKTRSNEIEHPYFVETTYDKYAAEYVTDLLSVASGKHFGLLTRILNRIVGGNKVYKKILNTKFSQKKRIVLLNRITCESYNELFARGLRITIDKDNMTTK